MEDFAFSPKVAALAAVLLALVAWIGDRRRSRREDADAVGFMPWTTVFVWSAFAAVLLIAWAWQSGG